MPTLRDVAAEAGVAKVTVSNVLNGRRDQVSEATYARVMDAVRRLGYVRNASARALSAKSSGIIALVYRSAPAGATPLENPHHAIFLGELERAVNEAGLYLMVRSADSLAASAASLESWNVDGAIFLDTIALDVERIRRRHDVPMVFIDNDGGSEPVSTVGIDDDAGGYLAGAHLARAGHRNLGFIAWSDEDSASTAVPSGPDPVRSGTANLESKVSRRFEGFVRALDDLGVGFDPSNAVDCGLNFDDAVRVGEYFATHRPSVTGAFATADILAAGTLAGLQRAGVRVPAQFSLVGFDDVPVSHQVTPQLTTVRQDIPAKARAAVDMVLRLIAEGPDAPPGHETLGVSLVERESVARPPAMTEPTPSP